MAGAEQDISNNDDAPSSAPSPVNLTIEELKVLKECRWNSIVYRGFPLAVITATTAKVVTQAGYFRKYSGLFYTGMFTIGMFAGIGSYSETCAQKIMALEGSELGDKIRAHRKRAGLPIEEKSSMQSGDFEDEVPVELSVADDKPVTDPFHSPLDTETETSNKWDDIRKQSRKAHSSTSNERGISYDDLRLRNRANQGTYNSLTPEEEADIEKQSSSDRTRFNTQSNYTNKPSALDFSTADDSRFLDKRRDNVAKEGTENKSYAKGIPSKNKYGDDVEQM